MKNYLLAAEPTPSERIVRKANVRIREGQDESTVFTNRGVESFHEKYLREFPSYRGHKSDGSPCLGRKLGPAIPRSPCTGVKHAVSKDSIDP